MKKKLVKYEHNIKLSTKQMINTANDFFNVIKKRRTVRDYDPTTDVPIEIVENAIKSAATAPSGANQQPWHYVLVSNQNLKNKIRIAAEDEEKEFYSRRAPDEWLNALEHIGTDQNKPHLENAPFLIIIFAERYSIDKNGNKLKNYYVSESVGIATGILLSSLHMSGLVTLTHTPSPMKFLSKILKRPKNESPYLIIATGYPSKNATVPIITKKSPSEFLTKFL
jgi:iodotyrosine deiodinase